MSNRYNGFAAKIEGHDAIKGWMSRYGHPPLPELVAHHLRGGGMNGPDNISRFGFERDQWHSIWVETHPISIFFEAPAFVLVSHRYHRESLAIGGSSTYDRESVHQYNGEFKELTANTHEAMLAAFQELRGWPASE